ncbi:hypothetical protein TrVE_jg1240 [Triparma verrucosa]|uniref:Uncharacterized protein n=1 Tax=Triparma verrucosa TaxID=1606542 RepID=A0A9W7KRU7_9STRA|nr:hypothetical protein TrVE_jg1240 [Triparma verrucosa]
MSFCSNLSIFTFCDPAKAPSSSPSPLVSKEGYNVDEELDDLELGIDDAIDDKPSPLKGGTILMMENCVIIEEGSSDDENEKEKENEIEKMVENNKADDGGDSDSDASAEAFLLPKTPISPCAPPSTYNLHPSVSSINTKTTSSSHLTLPSHSNQQLQQKRPTPNKLFPNSILKSPPTLTPQKRSIISSPPPPRTSLKQKRLTFNPSATVTLVPPLKNPSDWDGVEFTKKDIWWEKDDYETFRRTSLMLARSSTSTSVWSSSQKWWCALGHSRRGLEHVVSPSLGQSRQSSVRRLIEQVLISQNIYINNPRLLASISVKYSKTSIQRARQQGLKDYVDAKDILIFSNEEIDGSEHKKIKLQETREITVVTRLEGEGGLCGEEKKEEKIKERAKGFGQEDGPRLALVVGLVG